MELSHHCHFVAASNLNLQNWWRLKQWVSEVNFYVATCSIKLFTMVKPGNMVLKPPLSFCRCIKPGILTCFSAVWLIVEIDKRNLGQRCGCHQLSGYWHCYVIVRTDETSRSNSIREVKMCNQFRGVKRDNLSREWRKGQE